MLYKFATVQSKPNQSFDMFLIRKVLSSVHRVDPKRKTWNAVAFKKSFSSYERKPLHRHDDGDDNMFPWRARRKQHQEDSDQDWEYQETWRDWLYSQRKTISRAALVTVGAGGYYWYHLEDTPITGRRRFMAMSEAQEKVISELSFRQVIQEFHGAILPPTHPAVRYVERVASKIIASISPRLIAPETQWRIFVVDSPVANAFVLPGGEIFVFTGILPVAANEDGLAAIIGHEVAHKLARHGAEKMSVYQFFTVAFNILQIFIVGDLGSPLRDLLQELFLFLPFSRKCEKEADYIGILLMAKACYDPEQAIGLWERMSRAAKGPQPPAIMSTHPSNQARIDNIRKWLPQALKEYENAGCHQKQDFYSSLFR